MNFYDTVLRIFSTLPVTTATGERSFSNLKYMKNYLRSTMNEPRLNGLAHIYINHDIALDYESVIDDFGRQNRRLQFALLSYREIKICLLDFAFKFLNRKRRI